MLSKQKTCLEKRQRILDFELFLDARLTASTFRRWRRALVTADGPPAIIYDIP